MPQVLKDEVEERIAGAALAVFAERGFEGASVAEIARRAGISAGNVYRYHASKEELFDAVVPEAFVAKLRALLRRRVEALAGVEDVRTLKPGAPFLVASEELFAFAIEHRLRVVVLLRNAAGTRWEGFAEETVATLRKLAIAHFRAIDPALAPTEAMRFDLELIYRNLLSSTAAILARFDDGAKIREALAAYAAYHLVGLASFFRR